MAEDPTGIVGEEEENVIERGREKMGKEGILGFVKKINK